MKSLAVLLIIVLLVVFISLLARYADPFDRAITRALDDQIRKMRGQQPRSAVSTVARSAAQGTRLSDAPFGAAMESEPAGVRLTKVPEASGAAAFGLLAGDLLTEVNGIPVSTPKDVWAALGQSHKPWFFGEREGSELSI